jgi:glucose-6-phosphate 1-dehydrogenase
MPTSTPCGIVIFGASGDLAKLKLLPALYELALQNLLDEKSYVVGYSRSVMTDEQFRARARESIDGHARTKPVDEAVWKKVESHLFYVSGDYDSQDSHAKCAQRMAELDKQFGTNPNRLFYISTPPTQFAPIIQCLGEQQAKSKASLGWQRIIIEKPFGRDLASAKALNELLHKYFAEEQVFRIDHYLGKETVQNLLVMRFANSIFEPIWNYKYIDHVQITVGETLGVGDRAGYYDKSGALRDMVQNHLFQLMAMVGMEPPTALDAVSIRDEKVKVFKSIRPFTGKHLQDFVVRGQYTAAEGKKAYLNEKDVPAGSQTETFVALKLFIDNWRWSGTPFYLRTGKYMPEKLSEVVVRFRSPPLALFQKQCESPVYPNDLIIRVQPEEGISWRFNGKVPGGSMNIKNVEMNMSYKTTFNVEPPEAYERLIFDAIAGDQTLFIRGDETEAAWQVVDPIVQSWEKNKVQPEGYTPGTWGPERAIRLIEDDGRRWLHTGDDTEPVIACSL